MISPELRAEIRRLFFAEHWKVGTIASQLEVHHDTVRQAIECERLNHFAAKARPHPLDPFLPFIRETLARHPRLVATRIYEMLRGRGYAGSAISLRRYLRPLRPTLANEAYLRLTVMPGEQAQADWGHFGRLRVGAGLRSLFCFVMVLSWSRAVHALFTLDQTLESFLRGHLLAFDAFGGVARQILYDNLKSAVLERRGDAIRFNPRLLELAGHYHFAPRPCAPARGNEKGKVERQIQYLRTSFFAARDFRDVDELNAQFRRWRDEVAHARPHPEEPERTVAQMLLAEQPRLIPLPEHPFETDTVRTVVSGKTPYVHFDRNLYSIPYELVRKPLTLVASSGVVRILDGSQEVARHMRSYDTRKAVEDPRHVEALAWAKRKAAAVTGRDRLQVAVPSTQVLFERLAERGESLSHHTARLLKLLDDYGTEELTKAVSEALAQGALGAGAVAHILEKQRRGRGLKPPMAIVLPDRPGVRDLNVIPHKLEDYDALADGHDDSDDER